MATAQPVPLVLDPSLEITQYIHDVWQVEDGLPQSNVNALAQTPDGYLWLGTQEGVVRFDGARFLVFDRNRVEGLGSNVIRTLLTARDGTLWIGTLGGLTRYRDGVFRTYTTADGLPGDIVRTLHEDRAGHLWIGTVGHGVSRFDGSTFTTYTTVDGLPDDNVLALAETPDGSIWVGTYHGLCRIRNSRVEPFVQQASLPAPHIFALLGGADNTLWIGTDRGLARYRNGDLTSYAGYEGIARARINTLLHDRSGDLWIGTQDTGLHRLDGDRLSSFSSANGLTRDMVSALFMDHEGSLWIGTDAGGLNRLRTGKFIPLSRSEGLSNDVVLVVMEDRHGVMWAGTDGGGLNRIAPDGTITHFTSRDGLPSDFVYALHEDRQGTLWVGTAGGFCRMEGSRFTCFTEKDGLSNREVFSIQEDHEGTLWIGTLIGPSYLRDGRLHPFTADSVLAQESITFIQEDRQGTLWIGTYSRGLYRLAGGRTEHFGTDDGLSNPSALTFHEDHRGTLWVGTYGGGLCRLETDRFRCFSTADGLYSDKILQILEDDNGFLWLGSLTGIFQVSLAEIDAYVAGRNGRITSHVYSEVDGLQHREMNGGTQPPAWRSRDGRLWFSTADGLASIAPAHVELNRVPAPVLLEDVLVNSTVVDWQRRSTFSPEKRNFEFHYTALSFAAPERVHFRYRLAGYDREWIDAGTRRQAYYTNLPPGTYRFEVKASNNDGLWTDAGTMYTFQVRPYFHETVWFYLLCGLACLLAGGALVRLRVHKLRTRQAELTQLIEERTHELQEREHALQELNANLEREVQRQLDVLLDERRRYERELIAAKETAEESARLKTAILRNMSHEIRTPITAILGFAHVLQEEVDTDQQEFVTYIGENGRRLLNTLNSILDLARLETDQVLLTVEPIDLCTTVQESITLLSPIARRKDVQLRAELPPGRSIVAGLDRNAIERILQNLVGNALKFTERGEVVVEVQVDDEHVYLKVRDTGIGISPDFLPHVFEEFKQESTGLARTHEGSGLGLAITKRLVEALQGTIEVTSQKYVGTTFTVTFPAYVPPPDAGSDGAASHNATAAVSLEVASPPH